jgi:hypothetical protein
LSAARFELSPSPWLAAGIVAAHLASGIAAFSVMRGLAGALVALALLALGSAAAWSRALLRSAGSVRALQVGGEFPVFELASGQSVSAAVGDRRYVTRYVVALPVGKPLSRTLLVTANMLGPREFRRFRLWAIWGRLPARLPAVAPKQLVV